MRSKRKTSHRSKAHIALVKSNRRRRVKRRTENARKRTIRQKKAFLRKEMSQIKNYVHQ